MLDHVLRYAVHHDRQSITITVNNSLTQLLDYTTMALVTSIATTLCTSNAKTFVFISNAKTFVPYIVYPLTQYSDSSYRRNLSYQKYGEPIPVNIISYFFSFPINGEKHNSINKRPIKVMHVMHKVPDCLAYIKAHQSQLSLMVYTWRHSYVGLMKIRSDFIFLKIK